MDKRCSHVTKMMYSSLKDNDTVPLLLHLRVAEDTVPHAT